MFRNLKDNFIILKKAIIKGEPITAIITNGIRKLAGYSNGYTPSRNLSNDKGYNIYLNKLHEKWEEETTRPSKVQLCFIITNKQDAGLLEATLENLGSLAPNSKIEIFENNNCKKILNQLRREEYSTSWFVFLRAGDTIFPWTTTRLETTIESMSDKNSILFDHDTKQNNIHSDPHLKPYFNKRYLLEYDLIQNGICISMNSLNEIQVDEKQTINDVLYSFLLNKETSNFRHIQELLLSQHTSYTADYKEIISKNYSERKIKLKEIDAKRSIHFSVDSFQKVSIIIPFRDKQELLENCITSILRYTDYENYEIVLANNNSEESQTLQYLAEIQKSQPHIKCIDINCEFNFSLINNQAVKASSGELLLFLNNDTEALHTGWLTLMVGELQQDKVGAVGPQLLYEDGTIQHAGVVAGIGHVAGHIFRGFDPKHVLPMHNIQSTQEVAAITGACLLTKRETFELLGGFDAENLKIAYNDVDYCFKVIDKDLKIIYSSHAKLSHFESKSRKFDLSKSQRDRYIKEVQFMNDNHQEILTSTEFYHPAFSIHSEDYSFNTMINEK